MNFVFAIPPLVLEKLEDHCDLALLPLSLPAGEKLLDHGKDLPRSLFRLLIVCLVAVKIDDNTVLDLA